jgi:hypothetical protein
MERLVSFFFAHASGPIWNWTDVMGYRVDPKNAQVLRAVEWVGTDGYPYWQGSLPQGQGADVFWKSVNDVRNVVQQIKVSSQRPACSSHWFSSL